MSETVPVDVVTTLLVSGVANRPMRFWAYESVRFTLEFRDGPRGPLIDVGDISVALQPPGGGPQLVPVEFVQRVSLGIYTCAIVPALAGIWEVVARCKSPSRSVAVRTFYVAALPSGTEPPPTTLITDVSGLFLLLSRDGSFIST